MLFPHFITPNFSAAIDKHFPLTKENKSYRAFIMYCSFGGWKVYEWIGLDVSRVACSILEEKELSSHYNSLPFLDEIKKNLIPSLEVSDWIPEKQARSITALDFGKFRQDIEQEREALAKAAIGDLVHWWSGAKHHRSIVKAERDTEKERHYMNSQRTSERQKKFQDYLNNLPSNTFSYLVNKNFDAAWQLCSDMAFADMQTKNMTKGAMLEIKQSPQPFYRTPGTNERLVSPGHNLTGIKSEIRRSLTRGCVEFDFANCHWAIMAKIFEMQELTKTLIKHETIWCALGVSGDEKTAVKEAITPLIFGRKLKTAEKHLPESFSIDRLMSHLFIRELISTVESYIATTRHNLQCSRHAAESKLFDLVSIRELELMEPFVDYSLSHMDECYMLIYQYDGCTFTFRNNKEHHIKTITELVNSNARKLGYMTFVEPKELI